MITFIIPTIGRDTLHRSLQSLEKQTNENWKAIVVFDGIEPNISVSNPKITVVRIEKNGVGKNGAGNVRNQGMKMADTEWIAFLDDDDTIAIDYVATFQNETKSNPNVDVLIFRMYNSGNPIDSRILPPLDTDNFYVGKVGISFALKRSIFLKGLHFTPSHIEDFEYLNAMREKNIVS